METAFNKQLQALRSTVRLSTNFKLKRIWTNTAFELAHFLLAKCLYKTLAQTDISSLPQLKTYSFHIVIRTNISIEIRQISIMFARWQWTDD